MEYTIDPVALDSSIRLTASKKRALLESLSCLNKLAPRELLCMLANDFVARPAGRESDRVHSVIGGHDVQRLLFTGGVRVAPLQQIAGGLFTSEDTASHEYYTNYLRRTYLTLDWLGFSAVHSLHVNLNADIEVTDIDFAPEFNTSRNNVHMVCAIAHSFFQLMMGRSVRQGRLAYYAERAETLALTEAELEVMAKFRVQIANFEMSLDALGGVLPYFVNLNLPMGSDHNASEFALQMLELMLTAYRNGSHWSPGTVYRGLANYCFHCDMPEFSAKLFELGRSGLWYEHTIIEKRDMDLLLTSLLRLLNYRGNKVN